MLKRVHQLATSGGLRFTYKAMREAAGLSLSPEDVREVLADLTTGDSIGRLASETTGEWMYVFKSQVGKQTVYIKIVLRDHCVVVSFHGDEGEDHEEDE